MNGRLSTPGPAAALVAVLALTLTACTQDPDSRPSAAATSSSTATSPTPSPSGTVVDATRLTKVASDDAPLAPGRYALGFSSERADPPMVVLEVPAGYLGRGDGYEISAEEGGFRHLDTWTVAEVAARPCGGATWFDPGPTVRDLANALAALPVWESTPPTPTTIGGHEGVVMELNLPAVLPAACGEEPSSWRDHHGSTQGVAAGKTQRLWIVDVDGQRLMMVVGYFPGPEGPSASTIEELNRMVEGAVFVDADLVAP
ncbi:hypothetical protein [Oryzobacter terrae]|uniref:hypothetical protein n=1 Tax=Oryzobacter terrae TaxID=1620385 RepID=UPI00366BEB71